MTLKMLSKAMRDPKLFAQTKALYSYLFIRADHKRDIAYPPKKQILQELNLTEGLFTQGLHVLEKCKYIKIETEEGINQKTKEPYTYVVYRLLNSEE